MPNLPSAKKRTKQNERNRIRNRARKSQVKTETRKLLEAISSGNSSEAKAALAKVTKKLDQVAAKGSMHKNTAARKKSRLARRVNAIQAAKPG